MSIKTRGFTLIELVVVIGVLTILSLLALARFLDLNDRAHAATNKGVGSGFATAIMLVNSAAFAQGIVGSATTNIEDIGSGIDVNANGFPVSVASNVSSLSSAAHCVEVWNGILQSSAPEVATSAGSTVDYVATVSGSTCTYTYQPDNTMTISYNSSNGDVNY